MTADQLAKMLFHFWNKTEDVEVSETLLNDAANMLREQQRTIDGDKRLIDLLYQKIAELEKQIESIVDKNKPEIDKCNAYIKQQEDRIEELEKQSEPSYFGLTNDHTWLSCDEKMYNKLKPTHRMKCYTTPQTKPLSDEEIEEYTYAFELWMLHNKDNIPQGLKDFARAIEAKVREEK